VTTFNEGLEADKGKSWTTAKEKFVHALQSFQSVPGTEKEQASCMWRAGFAYQHLEDYDNASKSYKDAVAKFQAASTTAPAQQSEFIRHFQSKPDDPVSTMGFCYSNLGQIAGMHGNYRDAKTNLEQAVALLGGIDNPPASTRGLLAHSYELLSLALKQLGDSKGAGDATAKATQLRSQ
jgi:tetratricopeptide (TPR) repeat protein